MKQKELLERLDQQRIVDAIAGAEKSSAGEIRVHIQPRAFGGDVQHVAEKTFERLGMTRTVDRSGVLLFIASEEQKFAIVGDQGINDKVEPAFWDTIAAGLGAHFRAGEFTEGIVEAVERVGARLAEHFPRRSDDTDELSNQISFPE